VNGPYVPIDQLPWDVYGDVIKSPMLPEHIKQELIRGRQLQEMGIGLRAANGPFRQMLDGAVCLADQTAVAGTTETSLFPVASYTGFAANQLRAGQKWKLTVYGIASTAGSSQGNITITPRFGSSSSGTSMGASAATALVASASNKPWMLEAWFTVRQVGNAGANSKAILYGKFYADPAIIAASTGQIVLFGSTASVSVDLSVASGLYIGVTLGSASDTMTPLDVILESLN
jgi:hypothetical protein